MKKQRLVRVARRARRFDKTMAPLGKWMLDTADEIWKRSDHLDTAVSDEVAQGLARIVRAGNDCLAANFDGTVEAWISFIETATADWFRNRGFAEWFCVAAANGFNTSRPRAIADAVVIRKTYTRRKARR